MLLPRCQCCSHEKCLIRDQRVTVCYARWRSDTRALFEPNFLVELQSVEDSLQDRCTYLRVLGCSGDYWRTVGSFAAVVYFTSCGYIPVVVVSGTNGLLSVMRAYWIMPP